MATTDPSKSNKEEDDKLEDEEIYSDVFLGDDKIEHLESGTDGVERAPTAPQEEVRRNKLEKMIKLDKVIFVINELKLDINKLIQNIGKQLQEHEDKKTQRFNRAKTSIFDWFKPHNKVHPATSIPQMKPLPAEQAADYKLIREILDNLKNYITTQKNLFLTTKALKNVTRYPLEPVMDVTFTKQDKYISLFLTVQDLNRGTFEISKAKGLGSGPASQIKDEALLEILTELGLDLINRDKHVIRFLDETGAEANKIVKKHVDAAYLELTKDSKNQPHEEKLKVLLTQLPQSDFQQMLDKIQGDFAAYKATRSNSPPTNETTKETPAPRRNPWM